MVKVLDQNAMIDLSIHRERVRVKVELCVQAQRIALLREQLAIVLVRKKSHVEHVPS